MAVDQQQGKRRFGFFVKALLVCLALIGAWVVVGNFWHWARPYWHAVAIASIAFTAGTFYGRFRRDEHAARRARKGLQPPR